MNELTKKLVKRRLNKQVNQALEIGKKKGLIISKNQFANGWNVILPGATVYHSCTDVDLIKYVKDY